MAGEPSWWRSLANHLSEIEPTGSLVVGSDTAGAAKVFVAAVRQFPRASSLTGQFLTTSSIQNNDIIIVE